MSTNESYVDIAGNTNSTTSIGKRQKWEYESYLFSEGDHDWLERMDEIGKDGWELVSVTVVPNGGYFYFKRPCL